MSTRVAVISIIVESQENVEELNRILSESRDYVIGRMGIPYRDRKVNIICVAVDAPQDMINSLTGKIGRLKGIMAKTTYSNVISEDDKDEKKDKDENKKSS